MNEKEKKTKIIDYLNQLHYYLSSQLTFDFNNDCDIDDSIDLKKFISELKKDFESENKT